MITAVLAIFSISPQHEILISFIFPLEIEEMILDLLSEGDKKHSESALKMCSLVCQAFLPICRKHIFRSIALGSSPTTHAFERFSVNHLKSLVTLAI